MGHRSSFLPCPRPSNASPLAMCGHRDTWGGREMVGTLAIACPRCHGDYIWLLVKTLAPSEPQNSWKLWMFIPLEHDNNRFWPTPICDFRFDVSSAESRAFGLEGSQVAAKFGKEEGHLGRLEIVWRIMMYHDMLMICWWYVDDMLMICWWYVDDICWWYVDDICWWYADDNMLMICCFSWCSKSTGGLWFFWL